MVSQKIESVATKLERIAQELDTKDEKQRQTLYRAVNELKDAADSVHHYERSLLTPWDGPANHPEEVA